MLKFLEDDYIGEIDGWKDQYEEEVLKPPKSMDDSAIDQTVGGERQSDN